MATIASKVRCIHRRCRTIGKVLEKGIQSTNQSRGARNNRKRGIGRCKGGNKGKEQ